MRIYLDNNATTAVHPDVLDVLERALRDEFGNASSIHKEGQGARRLLEEARDEVAGLIHATAREIVFTSGGSESNNAAIFGVANLVKRCHIVTTVIEHPSVLAPVQDLADRGVSEITLIPADRSGMVQAAEVIAAIRPDTRLVTMMLANNETGVMQPVAEVAAHCRARGIHFHCDAVQAAGKVKVDVDALAVDSLSLSAHKLHAPKGIGALYVRSGVTLHPFLLGGTQERRRRAGTENVPLAAAFGRAAKITSDLEPMRRIARLRDHMESELLSVLANCSVNGAKAERLPNTSNLRFAGMDAESLVIGLDLEGIAISGGSACASGRVEPSRTLLAMGLAEEEARSSVRVSLSRFTTDLEIERAVATMKELVPRSTAQAVWS